MQQRLAFLSIIARKKCLDIRCSCREVAKYDSNAISAIFIPRNQRLSPCEAGGLNIQNVYIQEPRNCHSPVFSPSAHLTAGQITIMIMAMAGIFHSVFVSLLLLALFCFTVLSAPIGLSSCVGSMDDSLPQFQPSDFDFSGNIRRYYIAAEQVLWDYVPSGWDSYEGVPIGESYRAALAGITTQGSLGTRWQKALYIGYTDATFTTPSPQPDWNAANGPILRAEVGDMIEILFVNNLPGLYASMHSMGLSYSKDNEGSLYPNNTMPGQNSLVAPGDAVAPGDCVVYKWLVNNGSAPTQGDVSHLWGYHSYIAMEEDMDAGLLGSTIVYNRGMMEATMASYREFVLIYMQYDESLSIMSAVNNEYLTGNDNIIPGTTTPSPTSPEPYGNSSIWQAQVTNLMSTGQLNSTQAPTFDTLNGLMFSNNVPFPMCANDPTIWYVTSFGDNSHVFHMHGNGFVHGGQNLASISTSPFLVCRLHPYFPGCPSLDNSESLVGLELTYDPF